MNWLVGTADAYCSRRCDSGPPWTSTTTGNGPSPAGRNRKPLTSSPSNDGKVDQFRMGTPVGVLRSSAWVILNVPSVAARTIAEGVLGGRVTEGNQRAIW